MTTGDQLFNVARIGIELRSSVDSACEWRRAAIVTRIASTVSLPASGRAARRWSVRTRGVAIELEHLATYGLPGRSTSAGRERRRSPSSRRGTGDLLGDPLADVAVG